MVGGLFEAGPGAYSQGNVVALAAGQPALTGPHAGKLLEFAVKRLNRPAEAAFLLSSGPVAGLHLVGQEVGHRVVDPSTLQRFSLQFLSMPFTFRVFLASTSALDQYRQGTDW